MAENTCKYLNLSGIRSEAVFSVEGYYEFMNAHTARMMLLDINLGDGCGYNLCKQIREETQIPIVFISAITAEESILLALNVGGDDFICKPYSLPVLLAKVKAILRRFPAKEENGIISFGECKADMENEILLRNGAPVPFKRMEKKLLFYLLRNRNRLIEKEELFQEVWQESYVGDGTLNVHIRKLREKIEQNPSAPDYIITEYGKGYIFILKEN